MKDLTAGVIPPLILLLPPFALGILFGPWFGRVVIPACLSPWFGFPAAGIICASVFYCISTIRKQGRYRKITISVFIWSGVVAAVFAAGVLHRHFHDIKSVADSHNLLKLADMGGRHVVSAQIIRAPVSYGNRLHFIAAARLIHAPFSPHIPVYGRFCITVPGISARDYHVGDIVRFSASFRRIRNFKTPGAFNYENWWGLRGIMVRGFAPHHLLFIKTGHEQHSAELSYPRYLLESARSRLMAGIDHCFTHRDEAGVAHALLFGNRGNLSPGLSDAFAMAGVGHLLAVSGLHMALVAMLVFFIVNWCLLRSEWLILRLPVGKIAIAVSMVAVVIYAGLAGFSPSATRAMVMILIFSMAFLLERPHTPLNSLAAAAWILLVISPGYLYDMAFQLSFTAVFFLILFSSCLQGRTGNTSMPGRLRAYIIALLAVTLIAAIATAPLTAWYFQRISFAGLALNLVLVPATCFMVLPALMAGAAVWPFFPAAADLFFWTPAEFFIHLILRIVTFTAGLPWSSMWIVRPHIWEIFIFYAAMLMTVISVSMELSAENKRILRGCAFLIFLFVPAGLFLNIYTMHGRKQMVLHVPDVGQGTCQVMELPGSRLMVMDAGGMRSSGFDPGSRIVAPFIRYLGYTHIDILAASHPETDHIGGLAALAKQFSVKELWTNSDTNPHNRAWNCLMNVVGKKGITHRVFHKDASFAMYGVKFQVLTSSGCSPVRNRNARSLVIRLSYQGHAILLTGDINKKREQCLVEKRPGSVDILVVPHHGSRTSSSRKFIKYFNPELAVIPAGFRNYLGLPVPDVLHGYMNAGVMVINTGEMGTFTAAMDDTGLHAGTFCQGAMEVR